MTINRPFILMAKAGRPKKTELTREELDLQADLEEEQFDKHPLWAPWRFIDKLSVNTGEIPTTDSGAKYVSRYPSIIERGNFVIRVREECDVPLSPQRALANDGKIYGVCLNRVSNRKDVAKIIYDTSYRVWLIYPKEKEEKTTKKKVRRK